MKEKRREEKRREEKRGSERTWNSKHMLKLGIHTSNSRKLPDSWFLMSAPFLTFEYISLKSNEYYV